MLTETTRLLLRDLRADDLESLLAISSDANVQRMMEGYLPENEADLREWLVGTIHHNEQMPRLSHNCAIVLKHTGQVIGWIGFGVPSEPVEGQLDFGYAMNPAFENRGYMTEAVKAMLAYCFEVVGAESVSAYHMDFNPASGRVMTKAGMQQQDVPMKDHESGEVHYTMTRDMWRGAGHVDPKGLAT